MQLFTNKKGSVIPFFVFFTYNNKHCFYKRAQDKIQGLQFFIIKRASMISFLLLVIYQQDRLGDSFSCVFSASDDKYCSYKRAQGKIQAMQLITKKKGSVIPFPAFSASDKKHCSY